MINRFFRDPLDATGGVAILPRSTAAQSLLQQLKSWQTNGEPKFGHQDSLAYGRKWYFEKGKIFDTSTNSPKSDNIDYLTGKSDIVDITFNAANGSFKYPYVFGWDVGNFYASRDYLINGVIKTDLLNHVKFVHQRGGINSFSWHCPNPTKAEGTGEFFKENDANYYGGNVLNAINQAGSANERFDEWLTNVVSFFKQIDDLGIPFIFRPLHEMNLQNTFWWDRSNADRQMFINFWQELYKILCNRFSNILFCYSINDVWQGGAVANANSFKQDFKNAFLDRYPGDDFVDIYGVDIYQKTNLMAGENDANFINRFKLSCQAMNEINSSKVCVVSETGNYNSTATNWWHTTFANAVKDSPIAFAMLWRNPCKWKDANSVCFGPYIGSNGEQSFKAFFQNNQSMFL